MFQISGLGDIVEGCTGFYAQQEFTVELDYRQQQKVARRMAYTALKELVPIFDKTVVSFIAGNHGEPRNSGKSFTTFSDNRDIMLGEELAEIFKEAPAYKDKIDFIMPDSLSITLDIRYSSNSCSWASDERWRQSTGKSKNLVG